MIGNINVSNFLPPKPISRVIAPEIITNATSVDPKIRESAANGLIKHLNYPRTSPLFKKTNEQLEQLFMSKIKEQQLTSFLLISKLLKGTVHNNSDIAKELLDNYSQSDKLHERDTVGKYLQTISNSNDSFECATVYFIFNKCIKSKDPNHLDTVSRYIYHIFSAEQPMDKSNEKVDSLIRSKDYKENLIVFSALTLLGQSNNTSHINSCKREIRRYINSDDIDIRNNISKFLAEVVGNTSDSLGDFANSLLAESCKSNKPNALDTASRCLFILLFSHESEARDRGRSALSWYLHAVPENRNQLLNPIIDFTNKRAHPEVDDMCLEHTTKLSSSNNELDRNIAASFLCSLLHKDSSVGLTKLNELLNSKNSNLYETGTMCLKILGLDTNPELKVTSNKTWYSVIKSNPEISRKVLVEFASHEDQRFRQIAQDVIKTFSNDNAHTIRELMANTLFYILGDNKQNHAIEFSQLLDSLTQSDQDNIQETTCICLVNLLFSPNEGLNNKALITLETLLKNESPRNNKLITKLNTLLSKKENQALLQKKESQLKRDFNSTNSNKRTLAESFFVVLLHFQASKSSLLGSIDTFASSIHPQQKIIAIRVMKNITFFKEGKSNFDNFLLQRYIGHSNDRIRRTTALHLYQIGKTFKFTPEYKALLAKYTTPSHTLQADTIRKTFNLVNA
jgi:hypothetical protein